MNLGDDGRWKMEDGRWKKDGKKMEKDQDKKDGGRGDGWAGTSR